MLTVTPDHWQTVVDWAQIVGALGAIIAIGFAVAAQRGSTRAQLAIVAERRRQFQLEILREIVTEVDDGFLYKIAEEPVRLRKFARRLDLLPGSDLPFWRDVIAMRWMDEVVVAMGVRDRWTAKSEEILNSAKEQETLEESERKNWQERHDRLKAEVVEIAAGFHEAVSSQLLRELVAAITDRVEAGNPDVLRRSGV